MANEEALRKQAIALYQQGKKIVYCLLANAISGAKLVKMFEEAKFRCVKVQFFSGSVV